jgi:hypothetical protein
MPDGAAKLASGTHVCDPESVTPVGVIAAALVPAMQNSASFALDAMVVVTTGAAAPLAAVACPSLYGIPTPAFCSATVCVADTTDPASVHVDPNVDEPLADANAFPVRVAVPDVVLPAVNATPGVSAPVPAAASKVRTRFPISGLAARAGAA